MDAFTGTFMFIGIGVLALAVIALAVWVAMLSSKIRALSDRMMIGNARPSASGSTGPMIVGGAAAEHPSAQLTQQYAPVRSIGTIGGQGVHGMQASQMGGVGAQGVAPQPNVGVGAGGNAALQSRQSIGLRTMTVSKENQVSGAGMSSNEHDEEFFSSYRTQSESQNTGSFGRAKPVIPFGSDKNREQRCESYTHEALDEEFDPDSIDFSRVRGYQHLQRR